MDENDIRRADEEDYVKKLLLTNVMIFCMVLFSGFSVRAGELPHINLRISSAKASSVTLKWKKLSDSKNYTVFRSKKKKGSYKKLKTLSASKTSYVDKKIRESKTYYYKVKAKTASGTVESNLITKVKVSGNYKKGSVYGPRLSKKQLKTVKDKVANFVNVYTQPNYTQFEKLLNAHDYLCTICSYQTKGWNVKYANTALGALKYKKAQCSGYARALKALCDGAGVPCKYVHANKKAMNPSHQWNMVKMRGKWYIVDAQLNDDAGGYYAFLIGKKGAKEMMPGVYVYNTKGRPSLSKSDFNLEKYGYYKESHYHFD